MWTNVCKYYLFLPLTLSNGVKRDVVEYDEFRFQREIICNVVCEECFQISIYIYPLFYQMVSHDMLLSMINSDFSQNSFVMLCEAMFAKIVFIFTAYFLKLVSNDMLLSTMNSDFSQNSLCNVVRRMFANIYLFLHLTLSNVVKRDVVENDELRFQPEFICNAVCEACFVYIYLYLPLIFSNWWKTTCCWIWQWTQISARNHL